MATGDEGGMDGIPWECGSHPPLPWLPLQEPRAPGWSPELRDGARAVQPRCIPSPAPGTGHRVLLIPGSSSDGSRLLPSQQGSESIALTRDSYFFSSPAKNTDLATPRGLRNQCHCHQALAGRTLPSPIQTKKGTLPFDVSE